LVECEIINQGWFGSLFSEGQDSALGGDSRLAVFAFGFAPADQT